VLVHERAEADKPKDESVLHRVKSMLAAGWGATGSVLASNRAQAGGAGAGMKFGTSASSHAPSHASSHSSSPYQILSAAKVSRSSPPPVMSMTSDLTKPSLWRSARVQPAASLSDVDIPAFLRRQGPDVDAAEAAINPFGPANPNLEQLVVSIAGHLEGGGLIEELPELVRGLNPEEDTRRAVQAATAYIGDEATCWMLLALWMVQRPAGAGLRDFEAPLLASVSLTSLTPRHIGRVWTIFDRELGQAAASDLAASAPDSGTPAGASTDSSSAALSRRQQRLSAALSGTGG